MSVGGGVEPGFLALEDGTVFHGEMTAAAGVATGEAVFTTAMTGYQEVVTDPSFCGQLVCFTAPMVGNYGVAPHRSESGAVHARAVVMREARGPEWTDWLAEQGVPALTGIDTRSLTLHLRQNGSLRGALAPARMSEEAALELARGEESMAGQALAGRVATPTPYAHSEKGDVAVAV